LFDIRVHEKEISCCLFMNSLKLLKYYQQLMRHDVLCQKFSPINTSFVYWVKTKTCIGLSGHNNIWLAFLFAHLFYPFRVQQKSHTVLYEQVLHYLRTINTYIGIAAPDIAYCLNLEAYWGKSTSYATHSAICETVQLCTIKKFKKFHQETINLEQSPNTT